MKRIAAEACRENYFSAAKQGPVIAAEPGKTKISIRLDKHVIDYFREQVERAGCGNSQTMINNALLAFIQQHAMIDVVR